MGIKLKLIVVAIAVSALACTGMAQPGGGGGRGAGQRMGGMMRANPFSMLNVKEIQEELKITADQKTKIDALRTEFQEAQSKARREGRDSGLSMEEQMKAGQKLTDDTTAKLNAILTADQQTRLKELRIQYAKNLALLQPDVQKALEFTTKQKDDVKALQAKQQQANVDLFTKLRNQELTQEDFQKTMTKNNDAMGAELVKLLTPEQATKFKAMSGKPFTFPKEMPGMGFGGPGGRRGGGGGAGRGGGGGGTGGGGGAGG